MSITKSPGTLASPSSANHSGIWVLAATILGSSMVFIDGTVVNVALPVLQRELGATAAQVQWVVEAYALFLAALILVGGSLGDRFGRKRIFLLGVVLFAGASMLCGFAPTANFLIVARALQGIAGALLTPGSLSIITAAFPAAERGRAIGTWSGFTAITSAVGPLVGGSLITYASWRWVFFINVPLAVIVVLISLAYVPESRDEYQTNALDWPGAITATLGLGALTFGLIQAGTLGFGAVGVIFPLLIGIGALGAFVFIEMHSAAPMMPLTVFRSRTFSGANLLTLLLYGALGGSLFFLPFNLIRAQGYTPLEAGLALLPFVVINFSLSRWAGGLVDRYGARLPLIIGPSIAALSFVLFALPGRGGSYWTTFFPAGVVLGLGMTITIAPLTTTVMGALEGRFAGLASGINNAVARAAGLLAVAVLGIVVQVVFSASLDSHIAALHVSPAIQAFMHNQQARGIDAMPPLTADAAIQARIHNAVLDSYVAGFRIQTLVAAGLALASSVFGGILIPGKKATNAVP